MREPEKVEQGERVETSTVWTLTSTPSWRWYVFCFPEPPNQLTHSARLSE